MILVRFVVRKKLISTREYEQVKRRIEEQSLENNKKNVQYARPCRCGQNGRPCCKRNDGLVNVNFSMSVDFVV